MKKLLVIMVVSSIFIWSTCTYAAFVSGSTGADGAFNPTVNTTVTLPPNGVLNYTTVNIPSGVTVTFQKNAANTPVYMLATGDVTIAGTINVNGSNGTTSNNGVGGPGGYDGGTGGGVNSDGGKGLGPGGGNPGKVVGGGGGGGGFGTGGANGWAGNWGTGGTTYGSAALLPLCGGSGGGGGSGSNQPGGGGGGAILVASSTSIILTGSITANGGNSSRLCSDCGGGAGGSGGGIRLVSNVISGNGTISAIGGSPGDRGGVGGKGRIRIEAATNGRTASTDPPYSYGLPGNAFLANIPALTISLIGGIAPPATPIGNYNQPDVLLPGTTTNPVTVNISASNIPVGTTVKVRVIPQYGADSSVNTTLSGTDQSSTASANVTLSTTYSNILTAEATFTVVAMFYNGEQIDKVHVAATMGGKSETTYITKSGKTIKGDLVAFAR